MVEVIYRIAEHDGGWGYRVGDTWSETFPTKEAARAAAHAAAAEQHVAGETRSISWEDTSGEWHSEVAQGGDRPDAKVAD